MKEKYYHIALDDYEQSVLIRCLNDKKTELIKEGVYTDAIDDLIIKIGFAKKERLKVVEKVSATREER